MENIRKEIESCTTTNEAYEKLWHDIEECENMEDCEKGVQKLCDILDKLHPSDAYILFRDYIKPFKKNKIIIECKKKNIKLYQELQNLKLEATKSYEHDHKCPTNLEVDRAITRAYGIVIRMFKTNIDMEQARFDKICEAINKIEEHLELDITDFSEDEDGGTNNDTTEDDDEQGCKEIIK